MATVHVGANTDPHRASFWLAPPEGWLVPADGRRASTTPYVLTHRAGRLRVAITPIRDRSTVRRLSAPGPGATDHSRSCWVSGLSTPAPHQLSGVPIVRDDNQPECRSSGIAESGRGSNARAAVCSRQAAVPTNRTWCLLWRPGNGPLRPLIRRARDRVLLVRPRAARAEPDPGEAIDREPGASHATSNGCLCMNRWTRGSP